MRHKKLLFAYIRHLAVFVYRFAVLPRSFAVIVCHLAVFVYPFAVLPCHLAVIVCPLTVLPRCLAVVVYRLTVFVSIRKMTTNHTAPAKLANHTNFLSESLSSVRVVRQLRCRSVVRGFASSNLYLLGAGV
jgi:hypothetical protein